MGLYQLRPSVVTMKISKEQTKWTLARQYPDWFEDVELMTRKPVVRINQHAMFKPCEIIHMIAVHISKKIPRYCLEAHDMAITASPSDDDYYRYTDTYFSIQLVDDTIEFVRNNDANDYDYEQTVLFSFSIYDPNIDLYEKLADIVGVLEKYHAI